MPRLSKIGAAALAAFGWTSGGIAASYLIVAGGGSGGTSNYFFWGNGGAGGAGGGAGGLLASTTILNPSLSYNVIVGAGAAGVTNGSGLQGNNSVFGTITATGGGYGAGNTPSGTALAGGAGGSAGGTVAWNYSGTVAGTAASPAGQGNAGGGITGTGGNRAGGGGGGAGAPGSQGNLDTNGGNGGNGLSSSISGASVTYAGGGGGSSSQGPQGSGGSGGGAAGSYGNIIGNAGTPNTGGGGGGVLNDSTQSTGGNGGSGIVIIRYPAPQKFGGGVVTAVGSDIVHTFTTSGVLSPLTSLTASYLIVAGGGGGGTGQGGGGGAGGLLSGSGLTIDTNSTYLVTVGSGGAGGADPYTYSASSGTSSVFSIVSTTAVGGGAGGNQQSPMNGTSGGSGGGAGGSGSGGSATAGQGNAGGSGTTSPINSGGGGGAGAAGGNGNGSNAGAGGIGISSSISGTATFYAGGGGGGGQSAGAAGGNGGGGAGATGDNAGTSGTANTGGGGGGARNQTNGGGPGGNGGSGIVIISYPGSTQQMAGGTVTIVGGNVIHTFTSSGFLTPIYNVNRSLRFRGSAGAYLNKTPTTAGNQQKWTWSAWVKLGNMSTSGALFNAGSGSGGGPITWLQLNGSKQLYFLTFDGSTFPANFTTNAIFVDPAAWYHIVCSVDTTQSVQANRVNIYVNGVLQSVSGTLQTLNGTTYINGVYPHRIGNDANTGGNQFDGYMTEINFVDGQALSPFSFGTFNSYGVWQPIKYAGSYGTNGFYLPFTNNTSTTTLGLDFSPNGNNWTTNNFSLTADYTYDSMTDVPTNTNATTANYCVLNPLKNTASVSSANLQTVNSGTAGYYTTYATTSMDSGKYYWEIQVFDDGTNARYAGFGIADPSTALTSSGSTLANTPSGVARGWMQTIRANIGYGTGLFNNNTTVNSITRATTSGTRTFMVAYDADTGKCWMGYEGGWWTGNPSAGTGEYFTATAPMMPFFTPYNDGITATFLVAPNFGQQPFAYTPPAGFLPLNTYNL